MLVSPGGFRFLGVITYLYTRLVWKPSLFSKIDPAKNEASLWQGWDKAIIAGVAFGLLTFTSINPVFIIRGSAVLGSWFIISEDKRMRDLQKNHPNG
jgi:hypothetical protein